jgi:hypothetical protein
MGTLLRVGLHWLGVLVYVLRLHRFVFWLNRRNPTVLLYHACETDESDFIRDLGCSTKPADFERQLDYLMRFYEVEPVSVLLSENVPDRAVAITFDDGYRSVYERAYPALKSRGLPASLYLVTSAVDNWT